MFVVGKTVTTILVNTFQSALLYTPKNKARSSRQVFPKSRLPVSSPNRRREGVLIAGNVRICYAISDSCKRTSCQKANFFMFQFVLSFLFPSVRAITGKFDRVFSALVLHHGVFGSDSMKNTLEWNRRKIFIGKSKRAYEAKFELRCNQLCGKSVILWSSVHDNISIYKGEAKACL